MHLRFSKDIESLLERATHQPLTLKAVLAETSERGFSLVIGLLVLPFLFPMPPGSTSVFGFGCLLLAVQMALGRRSPWLPKVMTQFKFPRRVSLQLLQALKRITKVLEKITRPRLRGIAENPYVWRVTGLCIAWLTVLLMLPIPLTNPLPASGILLLAVATLEADGLLTCIGYVLSVFITLVFALITYALLQAPDLLTRLVPFMGQ